MDAEDIVVVRALDVRVEHHPTTGVLFVEWALSENGVRQWRRSNTFAVGRALLDATDLVERELLTFLMASTEAKEQTLF